jgi:hypothetical protein
MWQSGDLSALETLTPLVYEELRKLVRSHLIFKRPDTPYPARAAKWKDNPAIASRYAMNCQTCHGEGQLPLDIAPLRK